MQERRGISVFRTTTRISNLSPTVSRRVCARAYRFLRARNICYGGWLAAFTELCDSFQRARTFNYTVNEADPALVRSRAASLAPEEQTLTRRGNSCRSSWNRGCWPTRAQSRRSSAGAETEKPFPNGTEARARRRVIVFKWPDGVR